MENMKLDELINKASNKLNESFNDFDSMNKWKSEMFTLINEIAEMRFPPSCSTKINNKENSLDPVNWSSARCISHNLLDSLIDHIEYIRDRPLWQPIPINVRLTLENDSLPEEEQSLSDVVDSIKKYILPYTLGNIHPRFWAWVVGEGTLGGVLADMIASTTNSMTGAGTHTAILVERTVIKWMREIFGYPEGNTGGLIVSGTTMGTLICLSAARQKVLNNVRKEGLVNGPQLVAYSSVEVHLCTIRALEVLGIGSNALRKIPIDENFSINIKELKAAIQLDRQNGFLPFCIIGNAGTIYSGGFDNLLSLSEVAQSENIWFHVDGAFGSFVILDPSRRHLVNGIEKSDSIAFDFHKWLHCQYESGCYIVRDPHILYSTYSSTPSYLLKFERGLTGYAPWPNSLGPEMSRSFRALRVWFTLKEHGLKKLGQKIAENCQQALYLASLLEKYQDFIHVVRPILLNVVNFRFQPKEYLNEIIDNLNNELMGDIQESGIAAPSTTTHINQRLYIRVAIVSHRSTLEDFHVFVESMLKFYYARLSTINQYDLFK